MSLLFVATCHFTLGSDLTRITFITLETPPDLKCKLRKMVGKVLGYDWNGPILEGPTDSDILVDFKMAEKNRRSKIEKK